MPIMIRKCFNCGKILGCSYPSGIKKECPTQPHTCRGVCPPDKAKSTYLICEKCTGEAIRKNGIDDPTSNGW